MDWSNVTGEELLDALKEVEWTTPPRPLTEFFQKFSTPKSYSKWEGRLKCNAYYYRTNYFAIITLVLVFAFLRNPLALGAVALAAFSLACLNDSFAVAVNERVMRGIRRLSPPLAAKLRAPASSRAGGRAGRPLKGAVHICGQDRRVIVALLSALSAVCWYLTSAILTFFGGIVLALGLTILHATFRSPNLKARLNSFREEFRAVWRGYSDAP
eukprot:jgi/Mesen1/925/ME000117S00079